MSGWRRPVVLLLLALAPRALVFPFAENVAGDAVVRAWLGHAWLEHPHLIGSSLQGCVQFGPLHFPLIALVEWLTGSLAHAGRVVSLLAGVASALPIFAIARRLFSERAGWLSAVVFSLWPLHVQASTTAASEAVSGLFVLVSVALIARFLDDGRREQLWLGALMLTLGAALRYDVWLLVPLIAALVWWCRRFVDGLSFGLIASVFPVAWLVGHLVDTGDLLFPIRVIDDYHRAWFVSEQAIWGPTAYRFIVAGFWPLTAAVTFTPMLAVAGGVGLARGWRSGARWLVLLVVVPAVLLSLRGALLGSFVPLARFTMKELSLFTVFIGAALATLPRAWASVALLALASWNPLLELNARAESRWANSFRAVSPLSLNAQPLREVTAAFRARAAPTDVVAVDVDPRGFDDLQFAFESRLPVEQVARRRAASFEQRTAQGPRWLVLFDGGVLDDRFGGHDWRLVARAAPVSLYER